MKKLKLFFVLGGGLLLTGAAIANYLLAQPEEQASDLALSNIEALGAIRDFDFPDDDVLDFYFGGQRWKRDPKDNTSGNWWPSTVTCRRPDGTSGGQVVCSGGGGNCWNGTNCL